MTEIEGGGPAFPLPVASMGTPTEITGLTKREWFAGMAIMGQSSFLDKTERGLSKKLAEQQAKNAFIFANAMLAEGSKAEGKTNE